MFYQVNRISIASASLIGPDAIANGMSHERLILAYR
jgi:hypothetical protein